MKKYKIKKDIPKNRDELLGNLLERANMGDDVPLALAYLINEIVPPDRTTKTVFKGLEKMIDG